MKIYESKAEDEQGWDEYVQSQESATFYHQFGWKRVVENSYGHKPHYLLAKEEELIKGVLPIIFMKSTLFGKKMVSLPFAPYGGVLGDNNTIEESLVEQAIKITKTNDADYMELRNNVIRDSKLSANTNYMTLTLKLNNNPELVWNGFSNKVRNAVRKSLKCGLEVDDGSVDDFYKLYSRNMRDLGTPTHSKDFFNAVISEFKDKSDIRIVLHKGNPVAAVVLLYFKDTVISGWAASDKKYKGLNSNNLLYWDAIKSACEKGYKFFDFGRSIEGLGTYRFKKPWGAEEKKLQYIYYLDDVKRIPDTSQTNLKRQWFAKVWMKLPLSVTNIIGGKLRGDLP